MSLVGTLGRMAVGVLVAKGVGKMMSGGRGGASQSGGGGLGGVLGGLLGGGGGGGGGLGGALGGALGGGSRQGGGGSGGGLGDLGALLGGKSGSLGGGQAGGMVGGLAGGLGGLLESLGGGAGAAGANTAPPSNGSLGDLLNSALQGEKVPEPSADQEALAKVMIVAMVSAAKSDGQIDQEEQQKIVSHLGDEVTEEERQFVLGEMQSPLDVDGLVKSVPRGSEAQVYMMSLMGIDLDSQEEARYLDGLRQKLGLTEQACNELHQKLGVPTLYS